MDHGESSKNSESSAKRQKLNDEIDKNENNAADNAVDAVDDDVNVVPVVVAAVAGDEARPNEEQRADILKLDIDCFDETLDYLPLNDVISVSKTCKRLRQAAGCSILQNYPNIEIMISKWGVLLSRNHRTFWINHLVPFIREILFSGQESLEQFFRIQQQFRRLKQISIRCINMTAVDIDRMKETLSKVEVLTLTAFSCENIDEFFGHCVNLRRLTIRSDENWIIREYPKLEYLNLSRSRRTANIEGMVRILELNPTIQKFATTMHCLWQHRDAIKSANGIKLNELAIKVVDDMDFFDMILTAIATNNPIRNVTVEFGAFCDFLNELYGLGVYKRLHLYYCKIVHFIENQDIERLATINGLVELDLHRCHNVLPALSSLEELRIKESRMIDPEAMATNLVNLKRLWVCSARPEEIIPFIRKSTELDKIRVDSFQDENHHGEDSYITDLQAMNRERQQLPDACKVTLYVYEKQYLATKWALTETNFGMIRMKRRESFRWVEHFNFL